MRGDLTRALTRFLSYSHASLSLCYSRTHSLSKTTARGRRNKCCIYWCRHRCFYNLIIFCSAPAQVNSEWNTSFSKKREPFTEWSVGRTTTTSCFDLTYVLDHSNNPGPYFSGDVGWYLIVIKMCDIIIELRHSLSFKMPKACPPRGKCEIIKLKIAMFAEMEW